ncbi:MAG TPA: YetF domain-containing protein [Gemmatimonadaceae bacterium]|nr:YetF domain-containing protein [Gemmatimonadaceae bacterium]
MNSIWQDMFTVGVPIAEKVLRTIGVYLFLIAGLRLFGKRELGQLNPLDFIVLLLLSNTVQNAIIGNDNSLIGGLIGAGVLFMVNDVLVRLAYRNPRARRLIEGRAEEIVLDGRVVARALQHNLITLEEIEVAARKQGIEHLKDVKCAYLEVSGAISFQMKEPTEAEHFHREVMARLESIEKRLATLATGAVLMIAAVGHPLGAQVSAPAAPSTDVWVVSMKQSGSTLTLGTPVNATHRTGYDNQPSFTPRGDAVLYTVVGDDGQADIWRFALPTGKPERLTETRESEYSATVTPDGHWFSVIRVEADSTQRLWKFPFDHRGEPVLVLERIKPVGYHVWAGDHTLVLFVLGNPATLQIADDRTGSAEIVSRNIGRALAKVPARGAVTFLQLVKDSASWISELDVHSKQVRRIAQPPVGADYHTWTPRGTLLAANGSVVYAWMDGRWRVVADFSGAGVRGITRLAVSPKGDWLAFVAEDKSAP